MKTLHRIADLSRFAWMPGAVALYCGLPRLGWALVGVTVCHILMATAVATIRERRAV